MKIIFDWKTEPWQATNPRSKRMARNWLISAVPSATSRSLDLCRVCTSS
ncbi:hypothetical protein ACVIWV_009881 [Bradyrhizobium diazoefficiens]|nr:hypothetical protein [Bradyrhizobium japonicum]MCP1784646.1 hypothetical protein [Bradyrhizobium japonicum]MCP1794874.1 hypothetical protein [Bradyrhizobium japonicum]MCP1810799.1 hypothetical protein [Bradyrhizobium japonicum]MCP1821556.1 hypothetical protein [Bradyrhizobium japonicum]